MIKNYTQFFSIIFLLILIQSCATHKSQFIPEDNIANIEIDKTISHTFYLIGDAGNSKIGEMSLPVQALKSRLESATSNSSVVFLGDNIYPLGMPKKGHENRAFSEHQLNVQTGLVKDSKASAIFVPGNHDWYSGGLKGLERQQKYVENQLDSKNVFFPEDGCPLQKVKINEDVVVIAVDTEWYITNWNKHPTINDNCEIKSREKFFEEFEGLIKKNADKTTIVALHHPMFTYGVHGGQYSLKKHLFPIKNIPLPGIGSLLNLIRKTGGVSPADNIHKRYLELQKRIVALSQYSDKVIFVSGHDHTLQYIVEDNIPQIISGAGSKNEVARLMNGSKFSHGGLGYAKLDVYTDGSSIVSFYATNEGNEKMIFRTNVLSEKKKELNSHSNEFASEKTASIYTKNETTKGRFHRALWGDRYREYYSVPVNVSTVNIDTLFGGLKVVRKGGGHQSKSLRLENSEGKEYMMRAMRKSADQYIQTSVFKDQYVLGQFVNTYPESLLSDFFTGSHPYAPFTIGALSDAVGIYHTNPVLYYIPKQKALNGYNDEHGDALYMIEERAASGHGDQKSFGYSNEIISTDDLFKNLRKNENHAVDKAAFVKARLFDMIIGDWDRHTDQWRWAVFEEGGKKLYRPVPRDRDQAFSVMGDGTVMGFMSRAIPALKMMEGFGDNIRNLEGFNLEMYALDMALLNAADKTLWDEQAVFLQQNITDKVIDEAFKFFPDEVNDETIQEIKRILIERRNNIKDISDEYYAFIQKYAVVKGTDKDDWFVVERLPNGNTKVTGYRIKKGKKEALIHKQIFNKKTTKEIWIYGLDDDDFFEIKGNGSQLIPIRIIGGQNNDTYVVENGKRVKIYDYKSKENNLEKANKAKVHLTDDYEVNLYSPKKLKGNTNQIIPTIGSNPDDGFKLGLNDIYTVYGFERNPFTQQHNFNAAYYFATGGFDFSYTGEFANVIGRLNVQIEAATTSSNYAINFFGIGNESENNTDLSLDYNRVKYETLKFAPSLVRRGQLGSVLKLSAIYESIEVEETNGRFVNFYFLFNPTSIFDTKKYGGVEATYEYENYDNKAHPTLGMRFSLIAGWKTNLENSDTSFGYIIPTLSFTHKVDNRGRVVLATKLKSHFTLGDDFAFYQAASIGGVDGLRGYRNQRFTSKNAFYQNTDLRFTFGNIKTGILPTKYGFYGGFDYGKVWMENDNSKKWHNSVGGGFFLNFSDLAVANISLFNSEDGNRFAFALGFNF